MPPPVLVVLNPASGGGRGAVLRPRVERVLRDRGVEFTLRETRGPGHATDLAGRAAEEGVQVVVAVGGDGTVHEAAAGMLTARDMAIESAPSGDVNGTLADCPALAVVPVGTGNDFYRMVGTSREPEEALDVLQRGRRHLFDVGRARWEDGGCRFVNLLGFGVDVEVLRRRRAFSRMPGIAQYMAALLVAILRYRPHPLRVRIEGGEVLEDRVHLAAITVGPSAGGGFLLNPTATPDDGRLDLCFIRALSYPEIAVCIPRVVRGTHGDLEPVRLRRFASARIERPQGAPAIQFQVDGELVDEAVEWLEVGVDPHCLPVLVPEEPAE